MRRSGIFIDPVYLHSTRGIGRVCKDMVKHCGISIQTIEYISPHMCKIILKNPMLYFLWEQVILPTILYFTKCKVFIAAGGTSPIFLSKRIKVILLVHDVLFLEKSLQARERVSLRQKMGRLYRKSIMNVALKRADYKITISNFTTNRLITLTKVTSVNTMLYNYVNHVYAAAETDRKNQVLIFTSRSYTKNPNLVLRALPRLISSFPGTQFIVVGLDKPINYQITTNRIVFYENVSDEFLSQLLRESKIAIVPSIYEGFGLPVLEATCSGCIPIVSNIEVFNEIAPNVEKFDPSCVGSLIAAVQKVFANLSQYEEIRNDLARIWLQKNTSYGKVLTNIVQSISNG